MKIIRADIRDLPAILSLQKLAYQSEAELVMDFSIHPLPQTLEGITEDFNCGVILKAVDNGEIVGFVRMRFSDNTLSIGRLIVTPSRRNQGIGTALLSSAENLYSHARFRYQRQADCKAKTDFAILVADFAPGLTITMVIDRLFSKSFPPRSPSDEKDVNLPTTLCSRSRRTVGTW